MNEFAMLSGLFVGGLLVLVILAVCGGAPKDGEDDSQDIGW